MFHEGNKPIKVSAVGSGETTAKTTLPSYSQPVCKQITVTHHSTINKLYNTKRAKKSLVDFTCFVYLSHKSSIKQCRNRLSRELNELTKEESYLVNKTYIWTMELLNDNSIMPVTIENAYNFVTLG